MDEFTAELKLAHGEILQLRALSSKFGERGRLARTFRRLAEMPSD